MSRNDSDNQKKGAAAPGSAVADWIKKSKAALSDKTALSDKIALSDKAALTRKSEQATGKSTNLPASRNVDAFLKTADQARAVASVREKQPAGRLIFALDATASREATWDQASQLQAEMFLAVQNLDAGQHQLAVQLCYFKGYAGFYRTDWFRDSAPLLNVMGKMRCEAGITKIERVLSHIQSETRSNKVQAAVYIGDCMEENPERLIQKAGELRLLGVPLFIFQEGNEPAAKSCFQRMADVSGGAYASFDHSSADHLRDLLKAVAIYAGGGLSALQKFSQLAHPDVARLSHQLGGKS